MLRSIPFGGGEIEPVRLRADFPVRGGRRRVGEGRYPFPDKAFGVLHPQGSLTGRSEK